MKNSGDDIIRYKSRAAMRYEFAEPILTHTSSIDLPSFVTRQSLSIDLWDSRHVVGVIVAIFIYRTLINKIAIYSSF